MLVNSDAHRFARQIRCHAVGAEGQARLGAAHVLLVGVGALGTHSAEALARAGIGQLTLVDRDVVELGNLHRQPLFDEGDAADGTPKAFAAARRIAAIASTCTVTPLAEDFDARTFESLGARPDLILDGTDNFGTRMLVNDLADRAGIPWIYGAAVGTTGRAMTIAGRRVAGLGSERATPCLRCLMPAPPPTGEIGTCESVGILSPAIAHVAAWQTTAAIRWLTGAAPRVTPGMLDLDIWESRFEMRLRDAQPDPECPTCGPDPTYPAIHAAPDDSARLCGRNAVQVRPRAGHSADLARLASTLEVCATAIEHSPQMLRFEVEGCRFTVFPGGRALIFGLDDRDRARVLYDRYVGG